MRCGVQIHGSHPAPEPSMSPIEPNGSGAAPFSGVAGQQGSREHAQKCAFCGELWVTLLSQVSSLSVVLFFEIMLVAAVLVITWFALYALYRLITDES